MTPPPDNSDATSPAESANRGSDGDDPPIPRRDDGSGPGQDQGLTPTLNDHYDTVEELIDDEFPEVETITICGAVYNRRAGDSRVMESQVLDLAAAGYDVDVLVLAANMDPPDGVALRSLGVGQDSYVGRLIRLVYPLTPLFLLTLWWLRRPDVVVAHRYPGNALASAAKRLFGTGYVYWSHPSADAWPRFEGIERLWIKTIQTLETCWFFSDADRVAAISEQSTRYIAQYVDRPVATVPNQPTPSRFNELVTTEHLDRAYGVDPTATTILFVGRLTEKKNLVRLLDLFEQVRNPGEDVQFVVTGSATRPEYRERLADTAGDRVVFTNSVTDSELGRLYDLADVFATCSLEEGWGLPISEAAHFDTIIVGFENHPAAIDADRSITVPSEEYEAFAAALRKGIDQASESTSNGDASDGQYNSAASGSGPRDGTNRSPDDESARVTGEPDGR